MRFLIVKVIVATELFGETAKKTFDVKRKPLEGTATRMSLEKKFAGDLAGTSQGEMLAAMTAVKGSAGYVAIETLTGSLSGKRGTFILQHSGTMAGGKQELSVTVVPDSGTGELVGLRGKMRIVIEGQAHYYELDYSGVVE